MRQPESQVSKRRLPPNLWRVPHAAGASPRKCPAMTHIRSVAISAICTALAIVPLIEAYAEDYELSLRVSADPHREADADAIGAIAGSNDIELALDTLLSEESSLRCILEALDRPESELGSTSLSDALALPNVDETEHSMTVSTDYAVGETFAGDDLPLVYAPAPIVLEWERVWLTGITVYYPSGFRFTRDGVAHRGPAEIRCGDKWGDETEGATVGDDRMVYGGVDNSSISDIQKAANRYCRSAYGSTAPYAEVKLPRNGDGVQIASVTIDFCPTDPIGPAVFATRRSIRCVRRAC